jgi:hypothetical protein
MSSSIIRIANVTIGSGLIIATMASSAPLGGLAVLPLIGAALVLTGIFGEHNAPAAANKAATAKRNKRVKGGSNVRAHAA